MLHVHVVDGAAQLPNPSTCSPKHAHLPSKRLPCLFVGCLLLCSPFATGAAERIGEVLEKLPHHEMLWPPLYEEEGPEPLNCC